MRAVERRRRRGERGGGAEWWGRRSRADSEVVGRSRQRQREGNTRGHEIIQRTARQIHLSENLGVFPWNMRQALS